MIGDENGNILRWDTRTTQAQQLVVFLQFRLNLY